jgi:GTP-binding protein
VNVAFGLWKQANVRVGTGELNRAMEEILRQVPPRRKHRHEPKIYFATQVGVGPPVFVFFVNAPDAFPADYRRYVANRLRERFTFPEVPIRLVFRQRESRYG